MTLARGYVAVRCDNVNLTLHPGETVAAARTLGLDAHFRSGVNDRGPIGRGGERAAGGCQTDQGGASGAICGSQASLPLCAPEPTDWRSVCDVAVDIFLPTIVNSAGGRQSVPTAGHADPQCAASGGGRNASRYPAKQTLASNELAATDAARSAPRTRRLRAARPSCGSR